MWVEKLIDLPYKENVNLFKWWCEENGIKKGLFDVDETVFSTRKVFFDRIDETAEWLSCINGLPKETWVKEIRDESNRLFETKSVNPNRWRFTMENLAQRYNLSKVERDFGVQILGLIYETPIPYLPGAEEGLKFFRDCELEVGFVTHAGKIWNDDKFRWLGLDRHVDLARDIWTVDVDGHKTAKSWMEAMISFGVTPKECLVLGDSARSDMIPVYECGVDVGHIFHVRGNSENWPVQNASLPEGIRRIRNIKNMVWLGQEMLFERRK